MAGKQFGETAHDGHGAPNTGVWGGGMGYGLHEPLVMAQYYGQPMEQAQCEGQPAGVSKETAPA